MSDLLKVDKEDAVTNLDGAFENILEKFHTVYDVTKELPAFSYFERADTSLVIVLRNAVHHRDHELFVSWNAAIILNGGPSAKAGAAYLLGSHSATDDRMTSRAFYLLHDFYARLAMSKANIRNPQALRRLWEAQLGWPELVERGKLERYPDSQVYFDVMPVLISAVAHVARSLRSLGLEPVRSDGVTYMEHFGDLPEPFLDALHISQLRIQW
jgi:hypothetical protein